MSTVYVFVLIAIIAAEICYLVAKKRKANVALWVLLGATFGPFAIPFVFFAKPRFSAEPQ